MSKTKLPETLPDTTHVFEIDIVGRVTKKTYRGEFQCKIATIKDQAMIAKHEAMMNGEYPIYLDAGVKKIHKQIAYLRYTITDSPIFWKNADLGYDLRDDNVIEEVYNQVIAFENEWLAKIWVEQEEDGNEEGSEETKES